MISQIFERPTRIASIIQGLLGGYALLGLILPVRTFLQPEKYAERFSPDIPRPLIDFVFNVMMALGAIGFVFALTAIGLSMLLWSGKRLRAARALAILQALCLPVGVVPGLLTFVFLRQDSVSGLFTQSNRGTGE